MLGGLFLQVGRDVVQIVKYLDGFVDVLRCCIIDHGSKLEPFSPPSFCRSGAGLQEYTYHYQKGYRQGHRQALHT